MKKLAGLGYSKCCCTCEIVHAVGMCLVVSSIPCCWSIGFQIKYVMNEFEWKSQVVKSMKSKLSFE